MAMSEQPADPNKPSRFAILMRRLYAGAPRIVRGAAIVIFAFVIITLLAAFTGATDVSREILFGLAAIWLGLGGLLLWASAAYRRLQSEYGGAGAGEAMATAADPDDSAA